MRAWEMHLNGVNQYVIAEELGVTQGRVSQMIKQQAKYHPSVGMSIEEKTAMAEARWQISESEIRNEIARQQREGREVIRTTTFPDGKVQTETTRDRSVDPALLRALSTHHDRRNRHSLNQASPDAAVNAVQVNVLKEFMDQGSGGGQKLTATEWNDRQNTVDV
ncbi:hypothetical protein [Synechococcus sp. MIT S9509]|uniref:hypothetical protein n=1 Tax=Synechococcus sp. MIT S9509 TaxID=1801630 RepID=UPI001E4E195D|nr:hypothetical protein [Synechococcus sp. MIT S9509]